MFTARQSNKSIDKLTNKHANGDDENFGIFVDSLLSVRLRKPASELRLPTNEHLTRGILF